MQERGRDQGYYNYTVVYFRGCLEQRNLDAVKAVVASLDEILDLHG